MPAFVETAGRSWRETAFTCALFSLGDASLTLIIYAVGVVVARHVGNMKRAKFYLLLAALGAVAAVVVELVAKAFGSWSYSERMPVFARRGCGANSATGDSCAGGSLDRVDMEQNRSDT